MVLQACFRGANNMMLDYLSNILEALKQPICSPKLVYLRPLSTLKVNVRSAANETFTESMKLISTRDAATKARLFQNLYETAIRYFHMGTTEYFFGTLTIFNQLVIYAGMFVHGHFDEIAELTLKLREHRDFYIRKEVMRLLPIIADYSPADMTSKTAAGESYMERTMSFLISQTKKQSDCECAFFAIGKLALATKELYTPFLTSSLDAIRHFLVYYLKSKIALDITSVFECVSNISKALGPVILKDIQDVIGIMLLTGLSLPLCNSLEILIQEIPQLSVEIQERLIDMISIALVGKTFYHDYSKSVDFNISSGSVYFPSDHRDFNSITSRIANLPLSKGRGDLQNSVEPSRNTEEILIALKTLGSFGFEEQNLSELLRNDILMYLSSDDSSVRKETIIAVSKIISTNPMYWQHTGSSVEVTNDIIQHLLSVAITDENSEIRILAISLFAETDQFDFHLGKVENIESLLMMLNDEIFEISEMMVMISCRLSLTNPAYVIPSLRRMVVQLLKQIEHSKNNQEKENCVKLLTTTIEYSEKWICPYIPGIAETILPKVLGANSRLATRYLEIIGSLATIGRHDLSPYVDTIIDILVECLLDQSSLIKRIASLKTLGKCARYCGVVSKPFKHHPELNEILISMLKSDEDAEIRQEAIKVIGNMGSVDPYLYSQYLRDSKLEISQSSMLESNSSTKALFLNNLNHRKTNFATQYTKKYGLQKNKSSSISDSPDKKIIEFGEDYQLQTFQNLDSDLPTDSLGTTFTTDDYHTQIALYSMLKVLKDPMLSEYHADAFNAINMICSTSGISVQKSLKDIVPVVIYAIHIGSVSLREYYFEQLGRLILSQRQLIRPYLGLVYELFKNDMSNSANQQSAAIALIETIAEVLVGDFGPHLSTVLPFLLNVIEKDQSETRNPTLRVLHAIQILCFSIDEYLSLTIPRLVALLDFRKQPVVVVDATLKTLTPIILTVNCRTFSSRIILPLIRLYRESPTLSLQNHIMDLFCVLMRQLQDDFVIFMPSIHNAILFCGNEKQHIEYERRSRDLFSNRLEPIELKAFHSSLRSEVTPNDDPLSKETNKYIPNPRILKRAWATASKVNKEDWAEWMKHLSVELLKESSSPSLRACAILATKYSLLGERLFNPAFVSCFSYISDSDKKDLIRSIDIVVANPQAPPEILQAILNLAEYMERDEKQIQIPLEKLGEYALKCHALAKALHYKEIEWELGGGENVIQDLIKLNQDLDNSDAAAGALAYLRKTRPDLANQAEWHARLGQWDQALISYKAIENNFNASLSDFNLDNSISRGYPSSTFEKSTISVSRKDSIIKVLSSLNDLGSDIKNETIDIFLGELSCYYHLADWEVLIPALKEMWNYNEDLRTKLAWIGVNIAWTINDIGQLETYLKYLSDSDIMKPFYTALVSISKNDFDEARRYISICRDKVLDEMSAQLTESLQRGYTLSLQCQMLSELEEVITFKSVDNNFAHRSLIIDTWQERLNECQRDVSTWQNLLQIRSSVLPKTRILKSWLEFAQMCMDSNQIKLCEQVLKMLIIDETAQRKASTLDLGSNTLVSVLESDSIVWDESVNSETVHRLDIVQKDNFLLHSNPMLDNSSMTKETSQEYLNYSSSLSIEDSFESLEPFFQSSVFPELMYVYYKFKWMMGSKQYALKHQKNISEKLAANIGFNFDSLELNPHQDMHNNEVNYSYQTAFQQTHNLSDSKKLLSKFYYTEAKWLFESIRNEYDFLKTEFIDGLDWYNSMNQVLKLYQASTILDKKSYLSWHTWALGHYQLTQIMQLEGKEVTNEIVEKHIVPSVYGFFKAIQLSKTDTTLQDTLRLLTAWFNYGHIDSVSQAISSTFNDVKITTWIQVIPQILARIHTPHDNIRNLIIRLLVDIGKAHPQAILFSLTVASKSKHGQKQIAANSILQKLRDFYPTLVEQTEMVGTELVRIAILWTEMWNESLEAASRMYFSVGDFKGMVEKLMPLHLMLHNKPETLRELHFIQTYGRELREAEEWCVRFSETMNSNPNPNYLRHAWDVYYSVFRRIEKSLKQMNSLNLKNAAPRLLDCKSLELAIPGFYSPNKPIVCIQSFNPHIYIYSSKQRPRRVQILGSDGKTYTFLLKGHEDLKQDERVMQLFDLINNLLNRDPETSRRHLTIERFPIIPLSPDTGLIGFYPNTDTLHSLIKSYRESRNIMINIEHKYMAYLAPDYDFCTVLERLEAFEYGMNRTEGDDLHRLLWYKSINAEAWLDRRNNYTRSLAVMSIAGYILGLGDRHPSNLLLHSSSGKVVHIDFGDCFETAINREKFPETVPFRLTRMLVKAMEVNGIEGSFKITAEHTMRVLRANRDSVMAVLEAFVYDPLVSWYYLQDREEEPKDLTNNYMATVQNLSQSLIKENRHFHKKIDEAVIQDQWQIANPKAVAIIRRISDKLSGTDFNPKVKLDIPRQVDSLIFQATLAENLCQSYFGWCPFW
ncbi:hypothetical protein BB560_004126 [Smittium megazygosporum]|uniref:Serine/threonine-protein kinase TOR n=1 Tax=Smittium megazygosporum TaxID=133381 RepID=A0A2T9ZA55_9FUNG|nr:hypothetical protein BB560_004126 [Smittium megazygosporum]